MATASVAKFATTPARLVDNTSYNASIMNCHRAIALMECVRSTGLNSGEPVDGPSIATVADVAAEMVRQVLNVLDEAPRAREGVA